MFKKLRSSFTGGSKSSSKVRLDVTVVSAAGLPGPTSCRVVWARQSKVQVTRQASVGETGAWCDGRARHAKFPFVHRIVG